MSIPLDSDSTSPEEQQSALFANLVLQQTNMALLFLGKTPSPGGEQVPVDLQAASMFIDTLGMIEARTKGNLTAPEQQFLRQNLTTLRMYFAEAVQHPQPPASEVREMPAPAATPAEAPAPAPAPPSSEPSADTAGSEEEARKRFTKKY